MISNHDLVRKLIDDSTSVLSGWDDRLGNYTHSYLDRWKLIENVVRECARFCSDSQSEDGVVYARDLLNHFNISKDDEK